EDANLNGVLDENEDDGNKSLPADNSAGKRVSVVFEYLTVFTREPNKRSDGSARININATPPPPELQPLIESTFGTARAGQILQNLAATPARSVLEFFVRSGMTTDEWEQVSDALTASNEEYLLGLINVNTASAAVLACVNGIGTDKAEELVSARLSRAQRDTSIAWAGEILGVAGAREAGPYLTG